MTGRATTTPRHDRAEELGTRPIGRLLWWTCSQTTLSVGIFGIYALTNAWFVARGVGETALAAVNLVAPLLLLLGAVSTTVGVGGASIVSRSLGTCEPENAAGAAGTSFAIFWITAIILTAVGLIFLDPLLQLVGATATTMPYARPYAAVLIGGTIFSTGFSAIVRAEGRLMFSTMLWVIPVLVQITLDPILIFGLRMGVTGAGLGTVGGQFVSANMAVWFFFAQRNRPYRIRRSDLRPRASEARRILAIGAPSFFAGFGATLLAVIINATLAGAGAVFLAAYAVAARVQTFASMPQAGITQGTQPIVSYNVGRGFRDRVQRTRALALYGTTAYGAIAAAFVAIAAEPIARLFLSDATTIETTAHALRIIVIGFVFAGIPTLISAYFQALGRPGASYAISIGTLLVLKLPLVLLLGLVGPTGIWIALPLGEMFSAIAALIILRLKAPQPSDLGGVF